MPSASMTQMIANAANDAGVPPTLAIQVALQESSFNPNAVSSAGAQGLFQLMPSTQQQYGVSNAFDAQQSATAGTQYLADLYDEFGDWFTALVAYNWGPGNVSAYGVSAAPASSVAYATNALNGAGQWQASLTPSSVAAGVQNLVSPAASANAVPPSDAAADLFIEQAPEEASVAGSGPNWILLALLGVGLYIVADMAFGG